MAAPKSKPKSAISKGKGGTRRQATAHEKAVLKAAKARGLTSIDLRKPLSKYARSLVSKFEPVYRQEASVVKVPRTAKLKGVTVAKGKAIVTKRTIDEVARYDKKTGRIVVTDSKRGTRRFAGRAKKANTRRVIIFKPGTSQQRRRTYSGAGGAAAAAKFLEEYDPDVLAEAEDFDEYYDDDLNQWLREDDDLNQWLREDENFDDQ